MSRSHNVEYRNRPLGAAMRYPNPASFEPGIAILLGAVNQDIAALGVPPYLARWTAADRDRGAEMFTHPGALIGGCLGDLLWNASQNDRLIALYPRPKRLQVMGGMLR